MGVSWAARSPGGGVIPKNQGKRMVDIDPAILNQLFETLEDWNACLSSLPDLPIAEEAPPPAPARRKPPAPSI
jgi:hypothetical protein